jgi:hypothetical protein
MGFQLIVRHIEVRRISLHDVWSIWDFVALGSVISRESHTRPSGVRSYGAGEYRRLASIEPRSGIVKEGLSPDTPASERDGILIACMVWAQIDYAVSGKRW